MAKKKIDFEPIAFEPEDSGSKIDFEPIAFEPEAAPKENTILDKMKAGVTGFGQGATFGYLPQLQAISEPALAKIYDWVTGSNVSEDLGDYTARRDSAIKAMDQIRKENPLAFGTGELTGGLTSVFLPGGALAKGASIPAKMLASGAAGAAQSFAQNPGDVEGVVNPWQLGDRVENAAVGGTISSVMPALPKVGKFLRNQGEELAFQSLGPFAAEAKKALAKDKVQDIGAAVLKEKIPGILPRSNKTMGELLENSVEKAGKRVNDFIENANTTQSFPAQKSEMADVLRRKLLKSDKAVGDVAGANQRNSAFMDMIDEFENSGSKNITGTKTVKSMQPKGEQWNSATQKLERQAADPLPDVPFSETLKVQNAKMVDVEPPADIPFSETLQTKTPIPGSKTNTDIVNPSNLKTEKVPEMKYKSGTQTTKGSMPGDVEIDPYTLKQKKKAPAKELKFDSGTQTINSKISGNTEVDPRTLKQVKKQLPKKELEFEQVSRKETVNAPKVEIDPYTLKQKKSKGKSIKDWWETSKVADDLSGWNKDTRVNPLTQTEEYNRALAETIKENFDKVGNYRDVSVPYSNLKEALKITQKREGHDLARQLTSPWALTALGGVGGATQGDNWEQRAENALYGAMVGKSIRGAEKLYKQGGSRLLNRTGRMLEGSGMLSDNPWLVPSLVRTQQGD